jgi:hypothetical protein
MTASHNRRRSPIAVAAAPRRRPGRLVRANASQSVTAVATSP